VRFNFGVKYDFRQNLRWLAAYPSGAKMAATARPGLLYGACFALAKTRAYCVWEQAAGAFPEKCVSAFSS